MYFIPDSMSHLAIINQRSLFEQWYVENCFNLAANPIGGKQCDLQWRAWIGALQNNR